MLPALANNLAWDTSRLALSGNLAVAAIPIITNQPQSLAVNPGSAASFTVGATGTGPLAYQWQKNGTNISGATTNLYSIAGAAVGDAADYTVVITNNFGSVTSAVAVLTVNIPPIFASAGFQGSGSFSLSFTGVSGETCVLLGASNLEPPLAWLPLATNTADSNGFFNFSDEQATNFWQRFYRLMVQ
jgi:hypothetical protein